MPTLPLTPDELLSTTRSVRKRLDLTRPVERQVLEECLALAQQAPRASNIESRRFVVVTAPEKRAALADLWRRGYDRYMARRRTSDTEDGRQGPTGAILSSVEHLAEHMHEIPIHVVPCMLGRVEDRPATAQSSMYGSILPATWSFMLAARSRGLGTCWTTFHLIAEEEAAAILDIPYAEVTQVALIPVAYTLGTEFKPRAPSRFPTSSNGTHGRTGRYPVAERQTVTQQSLRVPDDRALIGLVFNDYAGYLPDLPA